MENIIEKISRIFSSYEIMDSRRQLKCEELAAQKLLPIFKTYRDFRSALGTAFRNDRSELFDEMFGRLLGECGGGASKEIDQIDSALKPLIQNDRLLEIIELFLKPDYETPALRSEESHMIRDLGDHLTSLVVAYYTLLKKGKFHPLVMHRLDVAAFKLLPLASVVALRAVQSEMVEEKDRRINQGRNKTKESQLKPERQAFYTALQELVAENEFFVELQKKTQFKKIKARMKKNGFDNFKVMDLSEKKTRRYEWLKEELAKLK